MNFPYRGRNVLLFKRFLVLVIQLLSVIMRRQSDTASIQFKTLDETGSNFIQSKIDTLIRTKIKRIQKDISWSFSEKSLTDERKLASI